MRSASAVCGRRAIPTLADVASLAATFTFHFVYHLFRIFYLFIFFVFLFIEFAATLEPALMVFLYFFAYCFD